MKSVKVVMIKAILVFSIAMLVTLAIFLFMQHLISTDPARLESVELAAVVELYQDPLKPDVEPEQNVEPEPVPEKIEEPQMNVPVDSAIEPLANANPIMPSVDMGSLSINVGETDGQWVIPVSGQAFESLEDGKDSKGYVEVVPYTTRRPNIPVLAWENKVNGWVLVVFTVNADGRTSNIRILDANPRGVFEEEVQKAVSFWRYDVSSQKKRTGEMILTQKISLHWKDYPDNAVH